MTINTAVKSQSRRSSTPIMYPATKEPTNASKNNNIHMASGGCMRIAIRCVSAASNMALMVGKIFAAINLSAKFNELILLTDFKAVCQI